MFRVKFVSFLLVLSVAATFILGGCKTSSEVFPTFTVNQTDLLDSTSQTSESDSLNNTVENVPHITVALPYSESTISYLSKLFYLKQTDSLGSNTTGATINLEYLDGISTPYIVDSILCANTGANLFTIDNWADNGGIPDLFLTNDLQGVYSEGYIYPMNEYIFDNKLLSNAGSIDSLYSCKINDDIYGIPYGFSYDLIYANIDYLPESFIEEYAIKTDSYIDLFSDVSSLDMFIVNNYPMNNNDSEEEANNESPVVFRSAYELILSDLDSDNLQIIKNWYELGYASEYDSNNSDPVYSRNAVMWIGNSSELEYWSQYYPDKLCYFGIPTNSDSNRYLATLYPICISSDSEFKSFACDFACFVAYDEDALLLISRLEDNNGIYPMSDDYSVWNSLTSDAQFGIIARSVQQQLNSISYSSNVINNELYTKSIVEAREAVALEEEENEQE